MQPAQKLPSVRHALLARPASAPRGPAGSTPARKCPAWALRSTRPISIGSERPWPSDGHRTAARRPHGSKTRRRLLPVTLAPYLLSSPSFSDPSGGGQFGSPEGNGWRRRWPSRRHAAPIRPRHGREQAGAFLSSPPAPRRSGRGSLAGGHAEMAAPPWHPSPVHACGLSRARRCRAAPRWCPLGAVRMRSGRHARRRPVLSRTEAVADRRSGAPGGQCR